ncbi:MAG TPA: DUF2231 domain-containing protein, partial [Holophagaceae bacterium]|nr:DUF2231 domain-containing protein [Holophagaceae bacterium]
MDATPLLQFIAKEHPAFVHVPIGTVVILPLAMLASLRAKSSLVWTQTAFFLAAVGLAGSLAAIISGLLWGRQIGLIPPGGLYPPQASSAQVLQRMLQL